MDIKNNIQPIREFAEQLIEIMDEFESKVEPDIEVGQYWEWNPAVGEGAFRIREINGTAFYDYINPKLSAKGSGRSDPKFLAKNARLLSDSEIEQALDKERKRRGFDVGVTVIRPPTYYTKRGLTAGKDKSKITQSNIKYWPQHDRLTADGITIYQQGDWAEIITDEWEVRYQDNDHKVINHSVSTSLTPPRIIKDKTHRLSKKEAEAIRDALNDLEQS